MENKLFIKNRNGLNLASVIRLPTNGGKHPAVIMLHGFTGYKDEEHISELAKELTENGIVAVRFDTSGFGESEGTVENNYRLSNFYTDTEDVFDFVKNLESVDKEKLGIWGNSLGGTMAVVFAANNPWVKSVCVVSAPTMFARKDNFERRTKSWKETGYFEKISSRYGQIKIPYDFVVDSQKWNGLDFISKVKQPILFIVGTSDVNVYPQNTRELFELASEPKEFFEIPNMKHDYKKIQSQIMEVNSKVINFYTRTLF